MASLLTLKDRTWFAALGLAFHPPDPQDPSFTLQDVCNRLHVETWDNTVHKTLVSMSALGVLEAERPESGPTRYRAASEDGDGPMVPRPPSPEERYGW